MVKGTAEDEFLLNVSLEEAGGGGGEEELTVLETCGPAPDGTAVCVGGGGRLLDWLDPVAEGNLEDFGESGESGLSGLFELFGLSGLFGLLVPDGASCRRTRAGRIWIGEGLRRW